MNQNSSISKMSDETILIENIKECCPYDVLPTTSIIEQLILGIVLVTMIMQYKEIPLETLLFNHPEGSLFDKINDKLGI